jgi:hypothetical protein
MQVFEFVLAIIALGMIFKLIKLAIIHNKLPRRDDSLDKDLMERLRQVEERVQVLERIVTDERYDLKRQFKDLGT